MAQIPFEVINQPTDESYPADLEPIKVAVHIAYNKAIAVKQYLNNVATNDKGYTILAADTIVFLNNIIMGKPKDRNDASRSFRKNAFGYHRSLYFI